MLLRIDWYNNLKWNTNISVLFWKKEKRTIQIDFVLQQNPISIISVYCLVPDRYGVDRDGSGCVDCFQVSGSSSIPVRFKHASCWSIFRVREKNYLVRLQSHQISSPYNLVVLAAKPQWLWRPWMTSTPVAATAISTAPRATASRETTPGAAAAASMPC